MLSLARTSKYVNNTSVLSITSKYVNNTSVLSINKSEEDS